MTDTVMWLAGIDWASETHQVCLLDIDGKLVGERAFPHGGAGLAALCDWLLEKTGATADNIAIAIEVPHGPIVETLLERGFVVYAINPKQVDRFRDRFSMAGAKDDRFDAHVLGDALRTDRHRLRRLQPTDPTVVELREWSRMGDELKHEQTRLANRIRDQLWRYYPQALKLSANIAANWFLDLWELAPTPARAVEVSESAVAEVLKTHRVRRLDAAEALAILRETPITVAPGTTEAATGHIRMLAARLKLVNDQIREADRQLDVLCDRLNEVKNGVSPEPNDKSDVEILKSCPGVGRIIVSTLISEAFDLFHRRDYDALRPLCGVAPVTKRSGKCKVVLMRHACHNRLRNAVYHWTRVAIQHDEVSRERYAALRQRGKTHGRAIRSVADRLLGVACSMLKNRTLFDSHRHTKRLGAAVTQPVTT